jgi:hypothetical protein
MGATDKKRSVDEKNLTEEENQALRQLLSDYKAAATVLVPGCRGGGLARKIAIALVQDGWRKQSG